MDARLIALASPVLFALFLLESSLLRKKGARGYRLHDSIADLSCGLGEQVVQVFSFLLELGVYVFVWNHRVRTASASSVLDWVLLFVLLDLAYYWFHRASHRVNFLWAIHAVHHQSEEYNFTVALRQGWLEPLAMVPFHAPLALLGFPPEMFFLAFTAHTLAQFWPHTRAVGKLPIDGFLNSPSNHRCHHAINPGYIDKNYSGVLILWDRLFGTWAREAAAPVYGTVKPLASFHPLWANVAYWGEMLSLARRCPSFLDKLSVPLRPPEWRPASLGGPVTIPEVSPETHAVYDVPTGKLLDRYALAAFALVVLALPALTQSPPSLGLGPKVAAAVFLLVSLSTIPGLIENKTWALPLEIARLLSLPVVAYLMARSTPFALPVAGGAALASLLLGALLARALSARPQPTTV